MKRPFPGFGMALAANGGQACLGEGWETTPWASCTSTNRGLTPPARPTNRLVLAACVALLSPSSFLLPPLQGASSKEVPMRATALRCEYLVNPLGIDEKRPRL